MKYYPTLDPYGKDSIKMPSEHITPTRSDSAHQQASTGPGDGRRVQDKSNKVSLGNKIKGFGKVIQGTVTGDQGTKEMGHETMHGGKQ
ncbi:hypothetical protein Clacol_007645 [Clathrus columnatus]|uniref:Dehydrin n=1 Tax=Clathrus columnatus TaxID=1419009 RepID=A0AAV5AKB8_9AGAM|nr:hypothetical protein Clacol_007645 [Clathrus columnatus]